MLTNFACPISRAWDYITALRLHHRVDRLGVIEQKPEKMLPKILNEWLCNVQLFPRVWFVEILRKVSDIRIRVPFECSFWTSVFGRRACMLVPDPERFQIENLENRIGFKFRVSTAILQTAGTDEHWKGIECDWICTSAIFVWLGWDSDSKLLKHSRSGTNLSCVTEKYLQKFLLQNGFCDCLDFIWA